MFGSIKSFILLDRSAACFSLIVVLGPSSSTRLFPSSTQARASCKFFFRQSVSRAGYSELHLSQVVRNRSDIASVSDNISQKF